MIKDMLKKFKYRIEPRKHRDARSVVERKVKEGALKAQKEYGKTFERLAEYDRA
jgi:hypothetical protein